MARHQSVPIDQRWLGMDKRGLPYALVALGLIVLMHWVVPAIDDATSWDNPTKAGDVLDLGRGITITPPVDWQLESGILTTDEPKVAPSPDGQEISLATGANAILVKGSKWDGTAAELLDQYNKVRTTSDEEPDRLFATTGNRGSFSTAGGITGVQEAYTSAGGDGRAFAFVMKDDEGESIGVVIALTNSDGTIGSVDKQIEAFASSLTTTEAPS